MHRESKLCASRREGAGEVRKAPHLGRPSGWAAAELFDLAAVAFGRAAGAAVTHEHARVGGFYRRAVVNEAVGRERRADSFANDLRDFDDPLPLGDSCLDAVADLDGACRLRRRPVQQDPTRAAQIGSNGARRRQPYRPQPDVEAHRFDVVIVPYRTSGRAGKQRQSAIVGGVLMKLIVARRQFGSPERRVWRANLDDVGDHRKTLHALTGIRLAVPLASGSRFHGQPVAILAGMETPTLLGASLHS